MSPVCAVSRDHGTEHCMYYACMTNVQIRDVPEEVHRELTRRAADAGRSLQQYLLVELTKLASRATNAELMARIEDRPKPSISVDEILETLNDGRAGR